MLYFFTILALSLRYLAGYPVRRQDLIHLVRTEDHCLHKPPLVLFEKHVPLYRTLYWVVKVGCKVANLYYHQHQADALPLPNDSSKIIHNVAMHATLTGCGRGHNIENSQEL
jgi:hypothetical protein